MLPWWETLLRLGLAMLLGGILGWERETAGKPAGFRTIIIVSLAAAIYILAAQEASARFHEVRDSVRAMTGVVGGVGFLGAGIILRSQGEVRWLTTAATVWAAAAIGMACGLGMYLIAIAGGILVFITLKLLPGLEKAGMRRRKPRRVTPPDDTEDGQLI